MFFSIFALGCLVNMPFPAFMLSLVNVKQGRAKISDNKVFGRFTSAIDILVIVTLPCFLGICIEEPYYFASH